MWDATGNSVTLTIGIASSPEDRQRLAQVLGATEAFLIVSSVDQARHFLNVVEASAAAGKPPDPPAAEPVPEATRPALSVDSERRVLRWQHREIELTPLEHALMRCLVTGPGQVWTFQRLHLEVWGTEHLGRGSDIHSVVRRVRAKLALLNATARIHAVRGVGFRLTAPI
ncbi:transcriptional regulator [Actinoplanes sp. ATCC 53533]|uniref:winged helix-turn-helix domain-containing protein n=1 Tax=Actinoplanes sp. ATCC 53533 TaxID=1288362 RepID=UPI000F7A86DA|nr:winged helix-turn-helix domain-containing protein [Actinoplanes sp. ATCC 53533]RSM62213.1 transcriptional regulator [Actinoplanes sp. ATCC 53533]